MGVVHFCQRLMSIVPEHGVVVYENIIKLPYSAPLACTKNPSKYHLFYIINSAILPKINWLLECQQLNFKKLVLR